MNAEIQEERNEADNANRGFPPGTTAAAKIGPPPMAPVAALRNPAQAQIHTTEASRLFRVYNAIDELP